ncbi:ankyrin repeat domain-containing protein [Deefgea piscis]|uniref:Ankyrin repeat domain-containing protein n=1 Tax=Deefgea piscis TaxID=2739061 RepID=A0A6M8SQM2_9NEIS|nr:ankyrin repeat domain-containing protein [Deefgea piscis]QKJ66428.1 ankyrin repeat domain-containing protein [Deefgea piscis]
MLHVQILIDHLRQHLGPNQFPSQLEASYPKVLARIMQSWEQNQLDACFNDLLIQGQQKQDGFPKAIATEIFRLQVALDALPAQTADLWGHIPPIKMDPDAKAILTQHGHSVSQKGLHQAIEQRHYHLLPVFIRAGMPIEQQDEAGWTPIMHACFAGKLDIVVQLIALKANLHAKDRHGYTLLHWAALNGNAELVKLLMGHQLNVQQASDKGITPLMQAAAGGHLAVMQLIIHHSGTLGINRQSQEGWTALHKATANQKFNAAIWLVQHGANPHLRNQQGDSACALALKLNQLRLYDLLNEYADRQNIQGEWQLG